jgi:hypothetical protein
MGKVNEEVEELARALCVVNSSLDYAEALEKAQSRKDLERAARLINWMAGYIGKMAPISYGACYSDLNEHFMAMQRLDISTDDPSKPKDDGRCES